MLSSAMFWKNQPRSKVWIATTTTTMIMKVESEGKVIWDNWEVHNDWAIRDNREENTSASDLTLNLRVRRFITSHKWKKTTFSSSDAIAVFMRFCVCYRRKSFLIRLVLRGKFLLCWEKCATFRVLFSNFFLLFGGECGDWIGIGDLWRHQSLEKSGK